MERAPQGWSHDKSYWWRDIVGVSTAGLPSSCVARLEWYERHSRKNRIGHYVVDTLSVITAGSVPAAASLGASSSVLGVLGAVVTAVVGIRQLANFQEDWTRFSRTLIALQREAVAFGVGADPYHNADTALAEIAINMELIVATETAQWSTMQEARKQLHNVHPEASQRSSVGSQQRGAGLE